MTDLTAHTRVEAVDVLARERRSTEQWQWDDQLLGVKATVTLTRLVRDGSDDDHDEIVMTAVDRRTGFIHCWSSDPAYPFDTSTHVPEGRWQFRVYRELPASVCDDIEAATGISMSEARA